MKVSPRTGSEPPVVNSECAPPASGSASRTPGNSLWTKWMPTVGKTYRISNYHTGDFIGKCEYADRDVARFVIVDPLRPMPKVKERCFYPFCILEDFHSGDHETTRFKPGGLIDVFYRNAKFELVEEAA